MLTAAKKNISVLQYAGEALKNDPVFMLAAFVCQANDAFLNQGHFFKGDFNAQIAAGHHNSVGNGHNGFNIIERFVPFDHQDSNYRMAFEALLSRAPVPKENIYRIPVELGWRESARTYEARLKNFS